MSLRNAKSKLNHNGGLSLLERRSIKSAIDIIYEDTISGATLTTPAGAGAGTLFTSSITQVGKVVTTQLVVDLTGLGSSTTDLDIIGVGASTAHIGQITTADNGVIYAGSMQCIVAPTTGVTDIDLYSATEGTGVFDGLVTALTETAVVTSGGAWTAARTAAFTSWPATDKYLYLTCGAAGTAGTYATGLFIITLTGYRA